MGKLEACDEETLSGKHEHKKQIRCGESELNTARYKNMGQGEYKNQELCTQALKAMLKIRGSRVRSLQFMQFLDFVQDTIP
jgi:hypothetical protein